jgi:ABC-type glycerol-3-phosphate transport system substrate-binding protein
MAAPTFDPDHPAPAYLQGWNLLIPTGSAHPDLAWKLIEHWTSPEIQLYQAENAGYIPVRSSVAQDPALADRGHIRWALDYAGQAPLEFDWPENYFALYATLAEMVSEVISERMTIDEAIAAAEKSYDSR